MPSYTSDLVDKTFELLTNDPALNARVKSFTKGDMNTARKIFPFVSVGNVRYTVTPRTAIHDMYSYSVDVLAGTHCLAPGAAFDGGKTGENGILQVCNAIVSALRGSTLDNFLTLPIREINISVGPGPAKSSFLWLATVNFTAEKMVQRQV